MKGNVSEYHEIIRATGAQASFIHQLKDVIRSISECKEGRTLHFIRFFISDAANQQDAVYDAATILNCPAVSVIQQPPLDGSKIAAWCYMTDGPLNPAYTHKMTCGITSDAGTPLLQTEDILRRNGAMLHSCIRTWFFVRDIDVNYGGVVSGRKNVFGEVGLTSSYMASTGIQGSVKRCNNIVTLDAYSIEGLRPGQKRHLYAPSHLCRTIDYGVTFERGTAIDYGDRRHVFISGTASIDNKGRILYPGDVVTQTVRVMENISALLSEADCGLHDIVQSVVYLRDPADYVCVKRVFSMKWPELNPLFVHAPVCRPGWLVEVECIASRRTLYNPQYQPFLPDATTL